MNYRVSYLDRAKRVWAEPIFPSPERAAKYMRALKRRGMTAWVDDEHGTFVPVPGQTRKPEHL